METSGVYFGSLATFVLSVKLEHIRIDTSLNILVTHEELENIRRIDISVHVTCYPETMPMSRHCEKTVFYFQNKAAYQAEDRPTDKCLKMTFTS